MYTGYIRKYFKNNKFYTIKRYKIDIWLSYLKQ